jgi:hypothetical protein
MGEQKEPDDRQAAKKQSSNGAKNANENGQHSTESKAPHEDGNRSPYVYGQGLFAPHLRRIGPDGTYDREAYLQLADCVRNHYRPVGFMEEFMVEKIVAEMVRCARVFGHEQRRLGYYGAPDSLEKIDLGLILRYSIAADRQLSHSIKELERMQAERKKLLSETSKGQGRKNGPVASTLDDDLSVFRLSWLVNYPKELDDQPNSESEANVTASEKTETKPAETKPRVSPFEQTLNEIVGLPADFDGKRKAADWKPEPTQDSPQSEAAPNAASANDPKLRNEPKITVRDHGKSD